MSVYTHSGRLGMIRRLFMGLGICLSLGLLLTLSWSKADMHSMLSWRVSPDRAKKKGHNEYDVIIVGSGFGGLSCGSLLAKKGYKVLVLEKNSVVGGLCSSYTMDGYRFCYGAEDIEGLGEKGSLSYLLRQLNIDPSTLFVPNTHTFHDRTRSFSVGNEKDAFERALIQTYPQDEVDIRRFFAAARTVYENGYDPQMVQQWGIIIPQELWPTVMPPEWNKRYADNHQDLLRWEKKPYQDILDEYFTNPDIKTVLCGFVSYLGVLPCSVSASTVALNSFGYFFSGGYQALGTPQRFAEVLASSIKEHGGEVLCNQYVEKILVGKNGVVGVRVGTKEFLAPIVVCNVNAKTAYFDLIDPDVMPPDFLKELWGLPLGNSAFALHLAVDHPLPNYTSICQDRYNHTYVAIPSKYDPSLAPKGKSAVILRQTVRFTSFIRNTKEETEQYIKERTEELLARGKELIPELEKAIVMQKVVTPHTFAELANIPYGAVYGFDTTRSSSRPYFRAPVPGLYMANASLGSPGVEGVVSAGILCAHDIDGWQHT